MKIIKSLVSTIGTLLVLGAIGIGTVWFFSNRSVEDQPTAQQVTATPAEREPTPTQEQKPTPTIEQKPTSDRQPTATPTLHPLTPPDDDSPEPTFTPVIILSKGTSPPIDEPPPSPTATPINPREENLLKLQSKAGQIAISPNDQELAFVQISPEDRSRSQLWRFEINDKTFTKVSEFGGIPDWSPNGNAITFFRRYTSEVDPSVIMAEVRLVVLDSKDEKILINKNRREVLDYIWTSMDRIDLITPNGIDDVDLNGRSTRRIDLSIPVDINGKLPPPKVDGSGRNFVVINEGQQLRVLQHNGQSVIIESPLGTEIPNTNGEGNTNTEPRRLSIDDFSLSTNKQQIAYVVYDGPIQALWVANVTGDNQRQLFKLSKGGQITKPHWAPNGQSIIIGHRPTGTYYDSAYQLVLINVNDGQITNLDVDNIDEGFVWSHNGQWVYYTRANLIEPPETYGVTLLRLRMKP